MLAAALFASLLAQAEQAPAPPQPAAPAAAEPAAAPGPAEPAPAAAPAPAEAAPAPAGPAAPPPAATAPAPRPVVADEAPALPRNSLSVQLRYAYRVGSDGDATGPSAGMSLGGEFEHRFLAYRSGIELGGAFDFFYDRFSKEVAAISTGPSGTPTGTVVDRTLSQTSFALLLTAAWRQADTRVFVAAGGGATIGYFTSPDMFSGSKTAAQPLARAVVGMDFALTPKIAALLRVDYDHSFNHESYGSALLFGDIFNAGAGLLLRF